MHWATAHRRGKTFGLSTAFAAEIGGLERKMRADGPSLQFLYPFPGKFDRGHAIWSEASRGSGCHAGDLDKCRRGI